MSDLHVNLNDLEIRATKAETVTWQEREALRMENGLALLPDVKMQNPSIELMVGVEESAYVCGDANVSGMADIDDIIYIIGYIFASGPEPNPMESGDVNCSGFVDIDDVIYLVGYIFTSGPWPCDIDDDGMPDC